ncbi:MAG TPA: hypothetical protein VLA61_07510 [Ideonella sp.]|uniref:hypothetical protein n=1 Tax=Ideonella sp. TaxID=1929293 RepID=UPI002BE4DA4D|nr:hypothetical protein [Ideonella sp.]HSI48097.1 hypothetical protein [Ideonella sp.]
MFHLSLRTACGLALVAAASSLAAPAAVAGTFAKNEKVVAAQFDLIDPEYNQQRAQFTWTDSLGNLWVAGIDRSTGLFSPANGKGTLIDSGALTSSEVQNIVGNGPEWALHANGDFIVYTKFLPNQAHTMPNARMAMAQLDAAGAWNWRWLASSLPRNAPYASKNAGDANPSVTYVDPQGNHYLRDLLSGTSEQLVSWYPQSYRSMRLVKGARAVLFVAPVNGVSQIFRFDYDSQALAQITFDDGDKDIHSVPWSWQAPEFANDFLISTLVNDTELRVYRQVDGTGPYTLISSQFTPNAGTMNSPEPFTYNGKSYLFFAVAPAGTNSPTSIYLTDLGVKPLMRQLTPTDNSHLRLDPEVFATAAGPVIYFNRYNPKAAPTDPKGPLASEGIFSSYTGIGPGPAPTN